MSKIRHLNTKVGKVCISKSVKLVKVSKNWLQLVEIDKNCQSLLKMVQIDKIGKNGKNWYSLVKMVKIAKHLLKFLQFGKK
jgi:hypothetical protein